jgi:CRP-like cAMP-binding protein
VVLFQNRLLTLMGRKSVARLGDTPIVALSMRQRLEETGTAGFVYFIEEGVASVIADGGPRMAMELGLIGREGMVGLALVYEDTENPYQTIVQVPGNAIQVDAKKLRSLMQEDGAVRRVLMRFARAFSIQVAATALANGRSKLDERLARWLIMVGDRAGPKFPITHEFISIMLGVRRSGVTTAVQLLESQGLIRASRGAITLLDREGLVRAANSAYGFAEKHYERLLGGDRTAL